jgi:hypothetical protein
MIFFPLRRGMALERQPGTGAHSDRLLVYADSEGELSLVTVFLSDDWMHAESVVEEQADGRVLLHLTSAVDHRSMSYVLQEAQD